jgi:hypothetical protein
MFYLFIEDCIEVANQVTFHQNGVTRQFQLLACGSLYFHSYHYNHFAYFLN